MLLQVHKQDYSKYSLLEKDKEFIFNEPLKIKYLIHNDIVEYKNEKITLVKRYKLPLIIGELDLNSKYKFKPNKKGVPSYLFKPLNDCYPAFMVCTNLKRKHNNNLFVTIEFNKWGKGDKFPRGNIVRVLGEIGDFDAIQNAVLYQKNLTNKKMKFNQKKIYQNFRELKKKKSSTDRFQLETKNKIISIDPPGCRDIDDALSYYVENSILHLQIHISDVYYLLKNLKLLDIENVTSIYLKDCVIPMLPNLISNNLGSLIEKEHRYMLSLFIEYDMDNNNVIDYHFKKTYGRINKNYDYDNYPKSINKHFGNVQNIYNIITQRYIHVSDSHKFIEALMIIYNTAFCKKIIQKEDLQIYRIQKKKEREKVSENLDKDLQKFVNIIKSNSAQYSTEKLGHETLNINDYSHVTSPLRRMVDLMNQEIYYTKNSSLLKKLPIEKINNFNKGLKKAYRDIDKLYLSYLVYNNGYKKTKCYIYDFNIEKNKMYLYFPDKKLSIRNKIVSYKIKDKFTVYSENNNLIIVNNENQDKKILPINKLIDVEVNGKPNIYNVDRSIYIKYLI